MQSLARQSERAGEGGATNQGGLMGESRGGVGWESGSVVSSLVNSRGVGE